MSLTEDKMLPSPSKGLLEIQGRISQPQKVRWCKGDQRKGDERAFILQGFVLASADPVASITWVAIPFFKTE